MDEVEQFIRTHVLGTNSVLLIDTMARYPSLPFFSMRGLMDALLKEPLNDIPVKGEEFRTSLMTGRIYRIHPLKINNPRHEMRLGLTQFFGLAQAKVRAGKDRGRRRYQMRRYAKDKIDAILNEAGFEPKKYGLTLGLRGRTRRGRFGENIEYGDEYYGPIGKVGDIEFLPVLRALNTFGVTYTLEGIDEVGEIYMWELTENERDSALTLMQADLLILCHYCETAFFDEYLVKEKKFRNIDKSGEQDRRRVVKPRCSECVREYTQAGNARRARIYRHNMTGAQIDSLKLTRAKRLRLKPSPRALQINDEEE